MKLYDRFYCPIGKRFWHRFFGRRVQLGFTEARGLDAIYLFGAYWRRVS